MAYNFYRWACVPISSSLPCFSSYCRYFELWSLASLSTSQRGKSDATSKENSESCSIVWKSKVLDLGPAGVQAPTCSPELIPPISSEFQFPFSTLFFILKKFDGHTFHGMGSYIFKEIVRNPHSEMPGPIPWGVHFVTGNAVLYSTSLVLPWCFTGFPGTWVFVFCFFSHRLSILNCLLVLDPVYSCSKHLTVLSQVKPKGLDQEGNDSLMAHYLCPAF